MSKFTAYLLALVKLTTLVCATILCVGMLYGLLSLATPRFPLAAALYTIGLSNLARFVYDPNRNSPQEDYTDVKSSHEAIRSWVIDCMGFDDFDDLPRRMMNIFALPSQYYPPLSDSDSKLLPQGTRMPNRGERALMQLSSTLGGQRIALRSRVQSAYFFWQCTSLITITLGMITTILVSVSSTEFGRGDGWNQRLIRILAIIFPALGTAAAATIAFYSPQAEWSQASRTLASVTQLHSQIALGVWKLACPQADNTEEAKLVTTNLDDWSKRYHDIQTVSSATGGATSTGGESSGGSGKPSSSSGPGGASGSKPSQ